MFGSLLAFQMTHQLLFVERIGSCLKTNEIECKSQLSREVQISKRHIVCHIFYTSHTNKTTNLLWTTKSSIQHISKSSCPTKRQIWILITHATVVLRKGLWPGMPLYRTVSDRGLWKKNRTKEVGLLFSFQSLSLPYSYPIHLLRPSFLISLSDLKSSQDPAPQHFHKPNYIDKARPQVTYSQVCTSYLQ